MNTTSGKPPRGPHWVVLLAFVLIAIVALVAGAALGPRIRAAAGKLAGAGVEPESQGTGTYYTCGMHPWVILPHPGDCPICHMKLTPLDASKLTGEMRIDPVVTQNIGVRVAAVSSGPLTRTIRTVGTVTYDEQRRRDAVVRVEGQVKKLYANYIGKPLAAGEVMADFHSPEVIAAGRELVAALKYAESDPEGLTVQASRDKLRFLGVPEDVVKEIEKTRSVPDTYPVRSPIAGVLWTKGGDEGHWLSKGEHLGEVVNLDEVWVNLTLYEYQMPYVQVGQEAVMTLPYIPGQRFVGKVIYIYPYLQEKSRAVIARLSFANTLGVLKPQMFASVELHSTLKQEATLAPRSAIIDTGQRQVAFVNLGEGRFEPREVKLGVDTGEGTVEILDGLKPGEMVVVSGQFLLDSESRIREALAKMVRGEMAVEQRSPSVTQAAKELAELPEEASRLINESLDAYFAVGTQLAGDKTEQIGEPALRLAGNIDALLKLEIPEDPHFWHKHDEVATIRAKALELTQSADITAARESFGDLSVALRKLVTATGVPESYGSKIEALRCPMYHAGQGGAYWLQRAGPVRNPYFGAVMLECFDRREALP